MQEVQKMWVWFLGQGDSPGVGKDNALQYSCWENKWTEEPGGLLSMGLQMVGDNSAHTNVISNLSAPSLIWIIVVDHMLNIYGLRVSKSQVVALCPWLPVFSLPSSLLIHHSPHYILYMRALIQILWQSWLHKFNLQPLKTIFFPLGTIQTWGPYTQEWLDMCVVLCKIKKWKKKMRHSWSC